MLNYGTCLSACTCQNAGIVIVFVSDGSCLVCELANAARWRSIQERGWQNRASLETFISSASQLCLHLSYVLTLFQLLLAPTCCDSTSPSFLSCEVLMYNSGTLWCLRELLVCQCECLCSCEASKQQPTNFSAFLIELTSHSRQTQFFFFTCIDTWVKGCG